MQSAIPGTFQWSYSDFESYPRKLICQTTYRDPADAHATTLNIATPTLFLSEDEEEEIEVPFRDLLPSGQGFEKWNILNDQALKEWLGDETTPGYARGMLAGNFTRRDPLCRFIYLCAAHSRAPLNISRRMLVRILTYHQLMPGFIDFLCVFGSQDEPRGLRFSGFREQTLLSKHIRGPAVEFLGRSGRQFQLCYNLKAVNCTSPPDTKFLMKQWSIRQAGIHHQFDVETGITVWIVVKGDKEIKNRIEDLTGPDGRPEDRSFNSPGECFNRTLGAHMVYCHWATEGWRSYIQWLEEYIDHETYTVFAPRNQNLNQYEFSPKDVQEVHSYEEKINVAIMTLEANVKILNTLKGFYERLAVDENFPWKESGKTYIMVFSDQLNAMMYDLDMEISRANLLNKIIADRKALVLQHIQAQGTDKMEQLTISMGELGIMAQKEAIAMRIITVVTVIFLPATFVSTFFSTEIMNYQNNGGFSKRAMLGWIEVTLPLTAITLGICYYFFKRSTRKRLENLRRVIKAKNGK